MKKLADPATPWSAREPHAPRGISFKLTAMFCISTNAKLAFTRNGGGVQRRGVGVSYDLVFTSNPQPGTNQRQASELNIKDPNVIAQYIAGYYFFVETVYRVFYRTGYHKTPGKMPQVVYNATQELLQEKLAGVIKEILDSGNFEKHEDAGPAMR